MIETHNERPFKNLFGLLNATQFFTLYCQEVKNWKHKCRGLDGNNNPITFSETDKYVIELGITRLVKDLEEFKNKF